ncbi:hypothetical protein CBM2588_B190195 [Cupriavidus taiwanensis]|nr:hypothetical protein CBM2588_B190195 [Cupriavidus taiwanensis]
MPSSWPTSSPTRQPSESQDAELLLSLQDQSIRVEEFSARSGAVPRNQTSIAQVSGAVVQMNTVTPQNAALSRPPKHHARLCAPSPACARGSG